MSLMEQRTTEWFLARKGKFTASGIFNLLATSRKKDEVFGEAALAYIKEKVAELVTDDAVFASMQDCAFSNAATRWGEQYEAEARECYSAFAGLPVEETGFVPYSEHSGGSPDGLVGDGEGVIEIKCPFTQSKHIEFMLLNDAAGLKEVSKQYYWQCQANLLFTGRRYIDFVSYDPRMSGLLKMKVLRIEPDAAAHELLRTRILLAEERLEATVSELARIGISQARGRLAGKQTVS